MKFTNGYWQMRTGMTPHYAAQVHDAEIGFPSLLFSTRDTATHRWTAAQTPERT
jgi:hypothetical protein